MILCFDVVSTTSVLYFCIASYPGLPTTVFVACSANTGGGLVKLITCNDVPACVEEWHITSVHL